MFRVWQGTRMATQVADVLAVVAILIIAMVLMLASVSSAILKMPMAALFWKVTGLMLCVAAIVVWWFIG